MKRLLPHVWFVDFEFSGTDRGERPTPICCVAREQHSGRTFRLWEDELAACPYGVGEDSVVVAYGAAAEISSHLALGWPMPANVIDLFAEFRCFTNTAPVKGEKPAPSGLADALEYFQIPIAVDKLEKKRMQERCARGGPWEPGEREEISAYCESDIPPLPALLEKLLPRLDLEQAVERGRFTKTVAHMEGVGIPIDVPKYNEVIRRRQLIIAKLITPADKTFQVYTGTTFKLDRFAECLEREKIADWPKTPSGRPVLKATELGSVLAKHPQMKPLFDLRGQIGKLRQCDLKIGHDGFSRTGLTPFVAVTGRSQPSGKEFIFALPKWMRFLIAAPEGYAVAQLDWSGQEIAIAAGKSGDQNLLKVYQSGDAHLAAGKLFGVIPDEGTTETHPAERDTTVEACLAELEGVEPPPPKPKRAKRAMQLGDGETLHPYVAKIIDNAETRIKTDEDPARALFIGANEAVRRANGHCIPDLDAVLGRLSAAALGEGVGHAETEKIIRSAKRNDEVAGVPTNLDARAKVLGGRAKVPGRAASAIKKGLIYG